MLHQNLGGSYTVQTDFGLFRIDSKDGDALGEKVPSGPRRPAQPRWRTVRPIREAIWGQLRTVFDPEIPVNIVDLGLVYSMDVSPCPN